MGIFSGRLNNIDNSSEDTTGLTFSERLKRKKEKEQRSVKTGEVEFKATPVATTRPIETTPSFVGPIKPEIPLEMPVEKPSAVIPSLRGGRQLSPRQEFAASRFDETQSERVLVKDKEAQRKKSLAGAEERLENLLKEAKQIEASPEPDVARQNQLTKETLAVRNLISANQPGFKTGALESLGFEPTTKFGAQLATPERQLESEKAIEEAREQKGFATGKVFTEIGKQAIQYATVGAAAKGLGLTSKIIAKLGGASAPFIADQLVDLGVDIAVQAPGEWKEALSNDKSLGADLLDMLGNRGWDVLINGVIGNFTASGKAAREQVLTQLKKTFNKNPQLIETVAKNVDSNKLKTIQQELGLPEETGIDFAAKQAKEISDDIEVEDFFKGFDKTPQQITDDFQTWRSKNFGGATGKVSDEDMVALKQLYKSDTGIDLDVAIKEVGQPLTTKPFSQRLKEKQQGFETEKPFKSIAEDTGIPKEEKLIVNLEDTEAFNKQVREIIEPDTTLPKTVDKLVQEGTGFKATEPVRAKNLDEAIADSKNLNDIGVSGRWTRDVFRNFEKAFGENFDVVKRALLDPFDASKKARIEDEILLTNSLKSDIVDKLGIKKGSKESKLVQRFGEKRISLDELQKELPDTWKNVVEADKWFREKYDTLIDEINAPLIARGKTPVPKRNDYYRHFKEMDDTFAGIKNVFESNQLISPKLEGLSEFTKPGTKWASFKQKRGLGEFKEDAVGGFLEYIKAGTYAKHIDPEIPKFRQLKNAIDEANPVGIKGVNHFSEFLDEWTNGLAGKTGFIDRAFIKGKGRKAAAILNLMNSRMKSNAVLGNASSALSQIANVPQGIAHVKNPVHLAGGLEGYFKSLVGGGDKTLYDQSGFLKERLTDSFSQFDTKIMQQPKKLAQWMLGALDETGTKFIWSAEYRKAVADGVQNPIKTADDMTRKLVAGRGIGEVPEIQRQKLFQLVAPFTLEVGNLWNVQKDMFKDKDFAGLAILYGANHLLNNAMEDVRGSRVVFDPIDAIRTGLEETEGEGFSDRLAAITGNLAGETLGNIPTGQIVAQLFPEFSKKTDIEIPDFVEKITPKLLKTEGEEGEPSTLKIPSREDLFGETDPTRFGTDLPLVKALGKPFSTFALPFGGQQIRKTTEGAQALGLLPALEGGKVKFPEFPSARTKTDKLISPVKPTISSTIQGLVFGKSAIPEVRAYYESGKPPFGEKQTEKFDKLVSTEAYDPNELFAAITEAKVFTKKAERIEILKKHYSGDKLNDILRTFFGYK